MMAVRSRTLQGCVAARDRLVADMMEEVPALRVVRDTMEDLSQGLVRESMAVALTTLREILNQPVINVANTRLDISCEKVQIMVVGQLYKKGYQDPDSRSLGLGTLQ